LIVLAAARRAATLSFGPGADGTHRRGVVRARWWEHL